MLTNVKLKTLKSSFPIEVNGNAINLFQAPIKCFKYGKKWHSMVLHIIKSYCINKTVCALRFHAAILVVFVSLQRLKNM